MIIDPERKLIFAILNMAISDAILVKRPKRYFSYKRKTKNESVCYEARSFLKYDNEVFKHYCHLVDIDPFSFYEKIKAFLKEYDSSSLSKNKFLIKRRIKSTKY